jgi:O-antigen ligase
MVEPSRPQLDLLFAASGLLLATATAGWLVLMAEVSGGDAKPTVAVLLVVIASFVAARWLTSCSGWLVPLAIAVAAAFVAVAQFDILLGRPLNNPFGYSNATGSFYMVASAAALLVAVRAPNAGVRVLAVVGAVAAALVPWLNETATASVLVCLLPLALFVRTQRAVRIAVCGAAAAMLITLSAAVILGATYQPGERTGAIDRVVDATLSERRPELWHDALVMLAAQPLTGVGPNRFPEESPTAKKDRDTRWPHNEALHFAAEAGLPGFLLLLGIFAWGLARLWWGAGDRGAAVAALALGAVGVHSNVDYVLHFPAIGIAAAALVGAGSRLPCPPSPRMLHSASGSARQTADEDPVEWDLSFLDEPVRGAERGRAAAQRHRVPTARRWFTGG